MSYMHPKVEDPVIMIIVTPTNFISCWGVTRGYASFVMRGWFDARERVAKKLDGWEEAEEYLTKGTFAWNIADAPEELDGGKTFAESVVAVSQIIGMYIREPEHCRPNYDLPGDEWKREED